VVFGTVADTLGHPVGAAELILFNATGRRVATTRSDARGHFSFSGLPPGTYELRVRHAGFELLVTHVGVGGGTRPHPLSLAMASSAPLTVAVTAQLDAARNALSPETGSSAYRFDQRAIQLLPAGANTTTSLMLAQAPGVSADAYGQGQDQLHIHGENGGGLQYRINGIFLPAAVSSYGEIFSPRFMRDVTLLTGTLPAQFGYRTEGVVDVTTKDGCVDGGRDNSNLEFFGGQRVTLQPSFEIGGCRGRLSYYIGGFYLQSTLGLQSPTASPSPRHDQTYQGQEFGSFSYLIDSHTRLSLFSGLAVNSFQIPPEPDLLPEFTLAGVSHFPSVETADSEIEQSYYNMLALQGSPDEAFTYQLAFFDFYYALNFYPDRIGDLIYDGVAARIFQSDFINGLQEDTSYQLGTDHTVRAGFYLSGETLALDDHALTFPTVGGVQSSEVPIRIVDDNNQVAWVVGLYGQDEWRPLPNLVVNGGLRWDWVAAFLTQNQLSPRLGADYRILPGTRLHAGYARYFKLPPFNSVELDTVEKFADTTNAAPVNGGNDRVSAERDDYFDIGAEQTLIRGVTLATDGFFKFGHDQLDLAQFAGTQVVAPLNYRASRGWGSDLSLSGQRGDFSGYFNFSYAVLEARNISAGQFLADDADEINYIARHFILLDDNQEFTSSWGLAYKLLGFVVSTDGTWGSGYRRGFANKAELSPGLQFNLAVMRTLDVPNIGSIESRFTVIDLFDHTYQIRNGTGLGVFSPQYAPRRAVYGGIKVPLGRL